MVFWDQPRLIHADRADDQRPFTSGALMPYGLDCQHGKSPRSVYGKIVVVASGSSELVKLVYIQPPGKGSF